MHYILIVEDIGSCSGVIIIKVFIIVWYNHRYQVSSNVLQPQNIEQAIYMVFETDRKYHINDIG